MSDLMLAAPLAGWVTPLDEVPDEVFAGRMMGEGVAIDLTRGKLCAPYDGIIISAASHAINLRTGNGAELLMHVGLETVTLKGNGFQSHVQEGDSVRTGDLLISMDIEFLAGEVKSLVSPVVVTNPEAFRLTDIQTGRQIEIGAPLMKIVPVSVHAHAMSAAAVDTTVRHAAICMLENGLHARPAARIAGAVKVAGCSAQLSVRGRVANAASVAALMALGVDKGDEVEINLQGRNCSEALEVVLAALTSEPGQENIAVGVQSAAPTLRTSDKDGTFSGVMAAPGLAVGTIFWLKKNRFSRPGDWSGLQNRGVGSGSGACCRESPSRA